MSDKGYVSIHRKIWDSAIWDTDDPFDYRSAWIDLVLMANYEDKQFFSKHGKVMTIRRGQTLVTVRRLSERWHWRKEKVSKYLTSLQLLGMIYQEKTQTGTLVTLRNYCDYQSILGGKRDAKRDAIRDAERDTTRDANRDRLNNSNNLSNKTNKGDADFSSDGDY